MKKLIFTLLILLTPLTAKADITQWYELGENDRYKHKQKYMAERIVVDGIECIVFATEYHYYYVEFNGAGISCNWNTGEGGTHNGADVEINNWRRDRD